MQVEEMYVSDFDQAMTEFRRLAEEIPEPDEPEVSDDARKPPVDGEVRFYKKHFSRRGGGDKMVEFHDCGHNSWTDGAYAPQARMGIEKFEGVNALPGLQKCRLCTGGGVWKVAY